VDAAAGVVVRTVTEKDVTVEETVAAEMGEVEAGEDGTAEDDLTIPVRALRVETSVRELQSKAAH